MSDQAGYWVVVPAAGVGNRVAADRPKQYLELAGQTILDLTLAQLLDHSAITGVVLVLSVYDKYFAASRYAADSRVVRVAGGLERCDSVLNGLQHLGALIDPEQPVLVHDAARPCVSHSDLDSLIRTGGCDSAGAVLGARVRDSMKSTDPDGRVMESVPREQLWHAYTPQMFPLGKLIEALEQCRREGLVVTDECSAMEHCGCRPQMIAGTSHNIKVTYTEDLAVAERILRQEGRLGP